ncbi:MAG: acetyl-CoA carboxylase biotin carboxylase subunit [Deltaproteobacteria bacterium]
MKGITRVLVANRGEIAVRVIRACQDLGVETVIAISEADRESLPVRMADRTICIGPARSQDSYLKVNTIVAAALGTDCDAIHPGYGFLCEQPELPETCAQHGLIFIGPTADNIRQMGDKILARKIAEEVGVPVTPGSELVQNVNAAMVTADNVGYPVLLKASAGGGGRGMVVVNSHDEMGVAYDVASGEAQAAFGDHRLYFEHYVRNARHIEVQIVGDHLGQVIHLGERDCSIQRRYQKILEEAPSPVVSAGLREKMVAAAIALANHIHYESVGTVEFLFDMDCGQFYFMEMNTRIQVEHPVTEMVSGVDLVKEQIRLAAHHPLSLSQSEVQLTGHAIECRINAESPEDSFRSCPGRINQWLPPEGQGIRVDSHCYSGYMVPPYYDSLLAKVVTKGSNRVEAIERMKYALANFVISGVNTTLLFHRRLLDHPDYVNSHVNTCWAQEVLLEGEAT